MKPNCPICNSVKHLTPLYTDITSWDYPGHFNIRKCSNCGLLIQSPRVPESEVGHYYDPKTYWGEVFDPWHEYSPLYKTIFNFHPLPGSILDIGSGLGLFLSEFSKRNWHCLGTEISPDMISYSRKKYHLKVLRGDLSHLKISDTLFDVISLNNVLEHLYYPQRALTKIHGLLQPSGLLVIVVPNIDSLGSYLFKRHWFHLQPGRHLTHFSPATLNLLLSKTGFRTIKINHSYWRHNYYSWFLNFKYNFSPKYSHHQNKSSVSKETKFSLIVFFGKILATAISFIGAAMGQIIRRGEVITVYAQKV